MKKFSFASLLILLTAVNSAMALDTVSVSYAQGEPANLRAGLLGAQWILPKPVFDFNDNFTNNWALTGLLDTQIGYWSGDGAASNGANAAIATAAAAPLIRIQTTVHNTNLMPYLEGGVGLAFYSHDQIADNQLGASWGFENKVGVGLIFGETKQYDISYHYVNFNNYHLYHQNDGFVADWMLTFAYHLA